MNWKLPLALAAVAGAGACAYLNPDARHRVEEALKSVTGSAAHAATVSGRGANSAPEPPAPAWDGLLRFDEDQRRTLGVATVAVASQAGPSLLKLIGQTDYDPDTLTTIRPQFNCRVEKVHIRQGSVVKRGTPLVDLFSNSLAESKSDYENKYIQWVHDKNLVDVKRDLFKTQSISKREVIEAENDERKSQVQMKLAKDELLVYGLSDKEIEDARHEVGAQKAKMVVRSPADGIVIKRDVVPGNLYDTSSSLLVIAPLDHLWVRGNVNEIDASKIALDQRLEVVFPYTDKHIPGKVEYIDKAIDPDTRAAKFRTSIPNTNGELKSGMFVRVLLDIPPVAGRTIIPRIAMVAIDSGGGGGSTPTSGMFVFVRIPGEAGTFERRAILPWQEGDDEVIVAEPTKDHLGLRPGEEIVTTGSLILEQIYEDKRMTETGAPL